MKSYKQILILSIILGLLVLGGCTKEALNKKPTTKFSEKDVWNDMDLVKLYVWDKYNDINWAFAYNGKRPIFSETLTDDAHSLFNYGEYVYNQGTIGPDDMGDFGGIWKGKYKSIRATNIFFDRIDGVEGDDAVKVRLKGEIRFIRAWQYNELIKNFGGVPLVTEPFKLHDHFDVPRDSYKDCVDFIVGELDKVIDNPDIPDVADGNEWGRVDKGAARALKSQVLLYAASKLHDPGSEPSGKYYDYDVSTKWQDAADAAKAVIDMPAYSLVPVNSVEDYQSIFLSFNSEIIFGRTRTALYAHYMSIDQQLSPNGLNLGGTNTSYTPTQNLVDKFQMKDGKSIDKSPLYDNSVSGIYQNKEIRFYADILYNGVSYRGQTMQFYKPGGNQSAQGPGGYQASKTGYSIRKFMDETYDWTGPVNSKNPRIFFRLSQIYLNYAEAEYHLQHESVARDYVNKIRERALLPDIASSGQQLLEDIMHERGIELCFENNYFYDALRWMTADDKFNDNAMGIDWSYVDGQGDLVSPNDASATLSYKFITTQTRHFEKKQYYAPIPRSEIQNVPSLDQNEGY